MIIYIILFKEIINNLIYNCKNMLKEVKNINGKIVLGNNEELYSEVLSSISNNDEINISTYSDYLYLVINFLNSNSNKIKNCNLFLGSSNISTHKKEKKELNGIDNIDYNLVKKFLNELIRINSMKFVNIYFSLNNHAKIISTKNKMFLGSQNILTKSKKYNIENGIIIDNGKDILEINNNFKEIFLSDNSCINLTENIGEIKNLNKFLDYLIEIESILNKLTSRFFSSDINNYGQVKLILDFIDYNDVEIFQSLLEKLVIEFNGLLEVDINDIRDDLNNEIDIIKNKFIDKIKGFYKVFGFKGVNIKGINLIYGIENFSEFIDNLFEDIIYLSEYISEFGLSHENIWQEIYENEGTGIDNIDDIDSLVESNKEEIFYEKINLINTDEDIINIIEKVDSIYEKINILKQNINEYTLKFFIY